MKNTTEREPLATTDAFSQKKISAAVQNRRNALLGVWFETGYAEGHLRIVRFFPNRGEPS